MGRADPVEVRPANVHEDDVGLERPRQLDRLPPVLGLADDLEVGPRLLDRLEEVGYIRRLPDRGDRRRVLVELTPRARKLAGELYGSFEAAAGGLRRDDPDKLALLRDFLDGGRRLYEQQAARLQATEKRPARAKQARSG